ncbi:MAG: TonB-dependent receptor [Acidobacteria bacterium]|nr:TonB-dependent receptor [Acidobacteriota bacterium]
MTRIIFAMGLAACLPAQSPQATVTGVITDPQGASIVGAQVTAVNIETGVETTAASNESGIYSLRFLPIGKYTIKASQAGFRGYTREGIVLTTEQKLQLDIQLELGAASETVTVSANASLLETRTAEVSQLMEAKTVEDIPLGDRRAMNMINLTGGAVFVNYDNGAKPNFILAGGRPQSQMFWIDGGTGQNMRLGIGQIDLDPPVETVQEMKVLSNGYSAEYGGSAGGVIIATTKSGTNLFKGSLFEYLRNDKLDAANFFSPISGNEKVKAPLRYNVFGGTIGGPIVHDKTFFFFGYEGSRRHDGTNRTMTVPTELQKAGDFSRTFNQQGQMIQIFDPATTTMQNGKNVRTQFPGNVIPKSRLDPVSLNLLPFYPVANRAPDNITGANNFRSNYVNLLTRDNFTAKVDHNLGSKDKLSGRYLYNSDNATNTSVFPNPAAETNNDTLRHQQYWYMSWTRIVTPALINEFRFTYSNRTNWAKSKGVGGDWPSKLGIKGVPDNAFPQIVTSGVNNLSNASQERRQYPIEQLQFVNNTSWIHGKHAFKFGVEVRPGRNYEANLPTGSGAFTFATTPTGQPGSAATGIGMATMLLGFPTAFTTRQTQVLDRKSYYLAGFAQDDWSITRDLTLNLGVRWETDTYMKDSENRMNSFDQNQINPVSGTPGVVKFLGVDGWRTSGWGTDWNNFGPRVGLAWRPFGSTKTVIRSGFGAFFSHPFDSGAPNSASLGFELSASRNTPDNGITAPFYMRDGVPAMNMTAPQLNDSFGAVPVGKAANTAVTFFETNRRTGYSLQYNLGVQHELASGTVLEVSYIANLSRKLPSSNISINQVRPELMGSNATQKDRPYPQFSNVTVIAPTFGVSNYHAAVVKFEKRFSHGFNLLGTYTYAKFLDNSSSGGTSLGDEVNPYSNYYNRRADYGPSENDLRHRVTFNSVYELPFGAGRAFLAKHPLRHVVGGWSVGSVMTLQSGAPFTVTTQTNTTNAFSSGGLRADVLRNPNLPNSQRTLGQWFDTAAFAQPANYTFGNEGVNLLRSDGKTKFDFSVLRNFPVGEEKRLQFRAEMFNAFNHPDFGIPGHTFGGPGFGIVSSADAARSIQLGLRFTF